MTNLAPTPTSPSTVGRSNAGRSAARAHQWKRTAFGAGLLHAVCMMLAFDPVGAWPAALAAVAPLVWIATSRRLDGVRWWKALAMVWAGILPFHLIHQAWVLSVSPIGHPLLAAYVAGFHAVFVVVLRKVAARTPAAALPLVAGVVWTALEVFRGDVLFKGYGWFNIAHPFADWPWAAAAGAVAGQFGVTFLAATFGATLCSLITSPRHIDRWLPTAGATVFVWIGLSAWGWNCGPRGDGRVLRVAVVQTNLPQSNKVAPTYASTLALWESLRSLTLRAGEADPRPDVIVWPETMKPGHSLDAVSVKAERDARIALFPPRDAAERSPVLTASFADATIELHRLVGVPLLVGEDAYDGLRFEPDPGGGFDIHYRRRFNSAFLIKNGAVEPARYDKVRLTPFGEEMPYISEWPWLERQLLDLAARGMKLDLSPGTSLTVFEVTAGSGTTARLVTPICFEATEWDLCRRMVFDGPTRRADVLVNITNDGWFGWWRGGRLQHLQIARWRSIELATPMIRAANTGISCAIDAHGRVTAVFAGPDGTDWNHAGLLHAQVHPGRGSTPMARGGWMTGWVLFAAGLVIVAWSLIPRQPADRTSALAGA